MKKEKIPHKKMYLTAVYLPAEESGYTAYIEEISGVNTQGDTLEEAKENLMDALELMLVLKHEMAEAELSGKKATREYIPIAI